MLDDFDQDDNGEIKRPKFVLSVLKNCLLFCVEGCIIIAMAFFGIMWMFEKLGANYSLALTLTCSILTAFVVAFCNYMTLEDCFNQFVKHIKDEQKKHLAQIEEERKRIISKWFSTYRSQFANIMEEHRIQYPWLAQQFADCFFAFDESIAHNLETKSHPAKSAAEEVRKIAAEKRELRKQCKIYEYEFNYIKSMFPWISDIIEEDAKELAEQNFCSDYEKAENDAVRKWLSASEYTKLSDEQKCQLALDRYKKSAKSKWQAGIAYERYVGYLFESKGFSVTYNGATAGKEDMGIDILALKDKRVVIVQCKRYSIARQSEVHENTVFQLFGTSTLYKYDHPELEITPVIYATYVLSDTARKCAKALSIELRENVTLKEYPVIKCNIAKSGEKIYHLPFDQQYDKIHICGKDGALYVSTVEEAEKLGFRHAYRWHPEKQ